MLELETINKLYLELSQVATAKTAREIHLAKELEYAMERNGKLSHTMTTIQLLADKRNARIVEATGMLRACMPFLPNGQQELFNRVDKFIVDVLKGD